MLRLIYKTTEQISAKFGMHGPYYILLTEFNVAVIGHRVVSPISC
jgi:hypothetical protein